MTRGSGAGRSSPLRVGVAGLGRIFALHARGYAQRKDAAIVALFDIDPSRLREQATAFPDATACTQFDQLLDQDLDLLEILTPHPLHAEQAIGALRRGVHVSVQKPMAMSLDEADRMIAAAEANGRQLRIFENFRFFAPLVKARQLIDEGAIGRPLHCRIRTVAGDPSRAWKVADGTWRWRAELFERQGVGRLTFDDGHHKMATALWFFGPVRDVLATVDVTETPHGSIDAPASITWRHVDPPVHVIWDVVYAPKMQIRTDYYALDECFEVTGEYGVITLTRATGRMLDQPILTLYRDGELRAFHNLDEDWGASFAGATEALIDGLKAGRAAPLCGHEGRAVLELGLAVGTSARCGTRVALSPSQAPAGGGEAC